MDVVADRGYYNGKEILACDEAGITVTLPKLEFLEQTAVRETDGNRVALRADIDTDTQLQSLGVQHGSLLQQTRPSDHPSVSSTCRATIASDRHHPGRPVG